MSRVQQSCGCGASIELDSRKDDVDTLMERARVWNERHQAEDTATRQKHWQQQAAVKNLHAAFSGYQTGEHTDAENLWVSNLYELFTELEPR